MNRISPEIRARRIELAGQFDAENLSRNVLSADETKQGEERRDLLQLVDAARPDLYHRGETVAFLDEAREGEGFRAMTIRERGSGILVAAIWAERFNLDKHIPEPDAQKKFIEGTAALGASDLVRDAEYVMNAAVHPDYARRGIAKRAFAAALSDLALFSKETAVFYRRTASNLAGKTVEDALGAEGVFTDKNRQGTDRRFNMIITSSEASV